MNRFSAACFAVAATLLAQAPVQAREYEPGGHYNACVDTFFDARYYGWLSIRNNCSDRLDIAFMKAGNPGWGVSAMELRPGASDNTGLSAREAPAGLTIAACRAGFIPVDANGKYWRGGRYSCKSN